MDFSIVVFDQFLDKHPVLIQHFVTHIGDIVKNGLVLNHEVLLDRCPGIHVWNGVDGRDNLDGNRLDLTLIVPRLCSSDELAMAGWIFAAHPNWSVLPILLLLLHTFLLNCAPVGVPSHLDVILVPELLLRPQPSILDAHPLSPVRRHFCVLVRHPASPLLPVLLFQLFLFHQFLFFLVSTIWQGRADKQRQSGVGTHSTSEYIAALLSAQLPEGA